MYICFGLHEKTINFEVAVAGGLKKWRGTTSKFREMNV
jgi:hypothetical protein